MIVARLGYASFTMSRAAHRDADERLGRKTDIMREQAMKVLRSTDVALSSLLEMTGGVSDAAIRDDFPRWHDRLAAMTRRLPHLQSISIIDAGGRVCATDAVAFPPDINVSRGDFLAPQTVAGAGLFIGTVLMPSPDGAISFFGVSRRRDRPDGGFAGVVVASLRPDYFERFYRDIGTEAGSFAALMRDDGTLLLRFPPLPAGAGPVPPPVMLEAVAGPADRGILTAVSSPDGREQRIAWQRLDPFPLFVVTGLETAAIRREWLNTLAPYIGFGLPSNLLLLGAVWLAWVRTRALFDEADRRAAAEEALQRAQRLEALGELTGGVAHDFNNLLMIVLGNVERMRRHPREARDIRALDTIGAAVRRGEMLTRQLLAFARRRALYPEPLDLACQLADMRRLLIHSLRANIVLAIEAEAPPGTWVVKVDVGEFELAVLNVVVNARDAMPQGGRLTLRLRRVMLTADQEIDDLRGDFVALTLTDTGAGIAPDVLPRVFDPFFTTKEVGKGTGLGLSQVYGFARQSGGTATIDSTPGAGTTVTLYLPFSHDMPVLQQPQGLPAPAAGRRGLLVEDDADAAAATRIRLELLGFEVTLAASGEAALSLLEPQSYALVVAGTRGPRDMSGMELAAALRARWPEIPVILAGGAETARQEGLIVLDQPGDEQQWRDAVTAALAGTNLAVAGG